MPTVSVLIAARDAAGFVGDAIGSALVQTLTDLEVIVVDDGSSDGTWNVILAAASADRRVLPLRRTRSGGPSAARNLAIAHARGRWLAVLDADDLFLPERLERMVPLAETAGADLLGDNLLERDFETGLPLGDFFTDVDTWPDGPVGLLDMLRRDMPDLPGRARFGFLKPIIRRDFLVSHHLAYRSEILAAEDFLLYAECVAAGAAFHLTRGAWYVYSRRTGSVSSRRVASYHLSQVNRRITTLVGSQPELEALLRRRQALIDSDCFDQAFQDREYRMALQYARQAQPKRMVRQVRITVGAMRRRLAAQAVALVRGTAAQ